MERFPPEPLKIPPFEPQQFLVLIVDDVSNNVALLVDILENVGYSTTFAKSGQQALERVQSIKPDLILLDLMMPNMNGLEVCEILKADKNYQDIPIIFLTASPDDQHLLEAFAKGAVDYVTKPFKTPELLARVKTHLDLKRIQDELRKAYLEMQKLATIDELTQVANYRAIMLFGEQEFNRSQRYNVHCSVILLDIDFFKRVNDSFDHEMGNKVLVTVVRTLEKGIRNVDKIGRFGGEEFLIILPQTPLEIALKVAERLRKSVAQLFFQEKDKLGQMTSFQVTISLGVDHYQEGDESIEQIRKRADQALNMAKNSGRNRVCCLSHLDQLDMIDELTQVANYRSIVAFAEQEFYSSKRYNIPLSLMLITIDQFKIITDSYSPSLKDQLIVTVAKTLSKNLRNMDKLGRFQAETFLVVLPQTSLDVALKVAERLRQNISEVLEKFTEASLTITLSLGVDHGQPQDHDIWAIIKRAEQGLLEAQSQGGNQVHSSSFNLLEISQPS